MKDCPKEYFYAVERVLREYPERERELRMLDRFIEECCHAILPDAESSGLSVKIPTSPQEKIVEVKEGNRYYRWLANFVELVKNALSRLTFEESQLVECMFWNDMSVQETSWEMSVGRNTVFRMRERIVRQLAPHFIPEIIPPVGRNWDLKSHPFS